MLHCSNPVGRGRGSLWVYHPRFPATFGKHWLGRGESLGDALVLLPSCLANTVMAPRKQPRGHQAQWLDPPSSQLSAQSHQLDLSPHPTSAQLGSLSQRQTGAFKGGLAIISLLVYPPTPFTDNLQVWVQILSLPVPSSTASGTAFSRKPPWVDPSPPGPDLTLGVSPSSLVPCLGLYLGPFSREVLSGE